MNRLPPNSSPPPMDPNPSDVTAGASHRRLSSSLCTCQTSELPHPKGARNLLVASARQVLETGCRFLAQKAIPQGIRGKREESRPVAFPMRVRQAVVRELTKAKPRQTDLLPTAEAPAAKPGARPEGRPPRANPLAERPPRTTPTSPYAPSAASRRTFQICSPGHLRYHSRSESSR
jgi:hypothetical protein